MPTAEFFHRRLKQRLSLPFSPLRRDDGEIQNLRLPRRLPPDDETNDLTVAFADQRQNAAPSQQLLKTPLGPLCRFGRCPQNLRRRCRVRFAKRSNPRGNRIAVRFSGHAPPFPSRKSPRPTAARNSHPAPARP